jgi:dCMP deaminase
MNFDWTDLAFGSKKTVRDLQAIFIAAPREISGKRFTQLVKTYLPQGNLVIGIAKEPYIDGFDGQPHFRTLAHETIEPIVRKVNASPAKHKIYTLCYFQREAPHILPKLGFTKVLLLNGSWHHSFHTRPEYYALVNAKIPYEMISPFANEQEAQTYAKRITTQFSKTWGETLRNTEVDMLRYAEEAARQSFDYCFQTGAALGKKQRGGKYKLLLTTFNHIVPYETFAMHHGAAREQHFSPPNDLNHYDTVHAEADTIIMANKQGIDLTGTTLFINLMPCPTCARMLCRTNIAEIVYSLDHSDGYAVRMLEKAGKVVRRVVLP